jgi:hypothetical protein
MSRQPISFRLTEIEFNALESNQIDNESLNQTAARLLRLQLGVTAQNSSSEVTEVKNLENLIEDKVNEAISLVYNRVDSIVDQINTRLKALENKPKTTRRTPKKSTETPE